MVADWSWLKDYEVWPSRRRLKGKYVKARSWFYFFFDFRPVMLPDGQYILKPKDLPADVDPRYWWTVIVYDAYTYRLHLKAGIHHPNPEGYVRCRWPWGGPAENHDFYLCENRKLSG